MKKLIIYFIMLCLCVPLMGCSEASKDYLNEIENEEGIKYLTDSTILFSYNNISGFDSAGIYYFVLKFDDQKIDFLSQFDGQKVEEYKTVQQGRNYNFEGKVESLINSHFQDAYDTFDNENRIDWNKKYSYINDTPDYVTFPMIYFDEYSTLILIKLKL